MPFTIWTGGENGLFWGWDRRLACGLLLKALENGHRCQFIRSQALFDEMYAAGRPFHAATPETPRSP